MLWCGAHQWLASKAIVAYAVAAHAIALTAPRSRELLCSLGVPAPPGKYACRENASRPPRLCDARAGEPPEQRQVSLYALRHLVCAMTKCDRSPDSEMVTAHTKSTVVTGVTGRTVSRRDWWSLGERSSGRGRWRTKRGADGAAGTIAGRRGRSFLRAGRRASVSA